jgi:hypothetical protein
MGDFRKYACDISGVLFKEVHRKGIRRERLSKELGISENQLKNYAYDSTKSATLENFLQVLIQYKCTSVLDDIANDMNCCTYQMPVSIDTKNCIANAASEALAETAKAVALCLESEDNCREQIKNEIRCAISKLLCLEKSL